MACAFADHKNADIRLEAAAAKYWCSETLWKMYDDYLQVRGGRGYESAKSLYARGERPTAVEMGLRDARINRIFEGSSQVMHLIMAREALDTHFKLVMPILQPKPGQKVSKREAMMKAAASTARGCRSCSCRTRRAPRDEAPERAQPQAPRLCGEDLEAARAALLATMASTARSSRRSRSSSATSSTSASTCS